MKNLTIEEKAKLYDKKLSDAKHILGDLSVSEDDKYFIRNLFPELKEIDDEKIRKALIKGFKVMKDTSYEGCTFSNYNIPITYIIAWLEKQGEQKLDCEVDCTTTEEWSKEDNNMMKAIIEDIHMGADFNADVMREANEREAWLKSLRCRYISLINRCTWEPSGEQLSALHYAAIYVKDSMFPYPKDILMDLYEQLKKLM